MVPGPCSPMAPVPPPAYHRAQAQAGPALHLDARWLVHHLHLLALCRLAVQLARWHCPPPLPAGPGGRPRVYTEESLLLLGLLRTLWRLSYQDLHDWLICWPALALACGLPVGGCAGAPARAQAGPAVQTRPAGRGAGGRGLAGGVGTIGGVSPPHRRPRPGGR